MSTPASLQKLLTWLSPAFPVGAFAWSAGLETAIHTAVRDRQTLEDWIRGALHHGGLHTDAIILAQAYRDARNEAALQNLADLYLALTPARERHEETTITGNAFVHAARAWPTPPLAPLPVPCPYPVAVGALAHAHDIDLADTALAWLTAAVQAQVSVAVRLVPIGQSDGLAAVAALEPDVASLAALCQGATLDDLGTLAYAADIAQMRHETKTTRIFRS
jgi:urease accessory protein